MRTPTTAASPSAGLTLLGQIAAQTSAAASSGGDDTVSAITGGGGSEGVSPAADGVAAAASKNTIGDSADNNAATPATTNPSAVSSPLDPCLAAVNNRDSNRMAPIVASASPSSSGGSSTISATAAAAAGTKRLASSAAAVSPASDALQSTATWPTYRMQRHCRGWRGEKYEALIHLSNYDALREAHAEKTTMADQYPLTTIYDKWAKYDEFEVRKEGPAGTAGSAYVVRSKKCLTELPPSRRAILCTECGSLAKALGDMNGHANREKGKQQYKYSAGNKLNAVKLTGGSASNGHDPEGTK